MARIGIIGAGIIGLNTAYKAIQHGHEVTVYEAMPYLGAGASGYNAGVIHVIQPPFNSLKSRLCLEGNKLYPSLSEEIGFKIRFLKTYLVYKGLYRTPLYRLIPLYLRRYGYEVKHVGKKKVLEACREASREIVGGLEVEGYAVVDPKDVLYHFYKILLDKGVEIRLGDKAKSIDISENGIHVYSSDEAIYDYLVIAAGGYTREMAKGMDREPPDQRFAKGVMVISKFDCDNIIAKLELFRSNEYTKGGGIIPRVDGDTVLFGPTFSWTPNPMDNTVTENEVYMTIEAYKELVNGEPEILSWYAGTRSINWPLDDFIIKFLYGKVAILYGIDSPGFTASPAISERIIKGLRLDREN